MGPSFDLLISFIANTSFFPVPVNIVLIKLLCLCSYLTSFFWLVCYSITGIQTLLTVFSTALISLYVLLNVIHHFC